MPNSFDSSIQEKIDKYELKTGAHKSIKEGACVMELVSYIADEPWSDNPECACPILTKFAIRINDRANDTQRQSLKSLIPLLLNSRNAKLILPRAKLLAHQAVTVFLPILTEALELTEITVKLRAFANNRESMLAARDYINSVRPEIKKADAASASAAAYAYASAAASAASAASAAYADASAADAADAADAAAYASASAAYAAAASAASADAQKTFWREVRDKIWQAAFAALKAACELKEDGHEGLA
jgi:hypothetical protein